MRSSGTRSGPPIGTPSEAGGVASDPEMKKPWDYQGLEGAGYRVRTGDIQLGKLTLYQLS